jgi:hypothetical protein
MRETCSARAVATVTHATEQHQMLPLLNLLELGLCLGCGWSEASPEMKNNWLQVKRSYPRRRRKRERDN